MALQISKDRVALGIILLGVHSADLDEHEDVTRDGIVAIGSLVFEGDLGLIAENETSTSHSNHSFDCRIQTSASVSKGTR